LSAHLGTVRFQAGDKIMVRVTRWFGDRPAYIEGRFCDARALPNRTPEDEDRFALKLSRRLARRHFCKTLFRN
jgi:hypothetical protein